MIVCFARARGGEIFWTRRWLRPQRQGPLRRLNLAVTLSLACGCAVETSPQDEEERIATQESALRVENAMVPNAMVPNAMVPNAMVPNAMVPNALAPATLASSAM